MCRLCDWGEMFPQEDPAADAAAAGAAAERQAASRMLWSQLMADIGEDDSAAPLRSGEPG